MMKARGRPRNFDDSRAVETAKALFHARGYDAVSVAELCTAIGIKPTSLYAAYGNKLGLFQRVLESYRTGETARALGKALAEATSAAELPGTLLEAAARAYVANPEQAGCLGLLASQSTRDEDARAAAAALVADSREIMVRRLDSLGVADPDGTADAIEVVLSGLSALARTGLPEPRLVESARALASGISTT